MTDSKGEQLSAGFVYVHWSIKGCVKICNDNSTLVVICTEHRYERNTFVLLPVFMSSTQKTERYCLSTNVSSGGIIYLPQR